MTDPETTLNYAPARQTKRIASRFLNGGTTLLGVSLLLMVLLPSGPLTVAWRVVLWAGIICAVAGLALSIVGVIRYMRSTKR